VVLCGDRVRASDEVVHQIPEVARMQVSVGFSVLDKSIGGLLAARAGYRSHRLVFPQARRLVFAEPSSDRSAVGSIAA
jgi:hypothetical protein